MILHTLQNEAFDGQENKQTHTFFNNYLIAVT